MDLSFALTVILISLSGVIAPGPLFAATIAEGRKHGFAGALITMGHATVEIPIIISLYLFGTFIATDFVKAVVGIMGGVVLLYLACLELKSGEAKVRPAKGYVTGIVMSFFNPYFIIWWLTVGFTLIMKSLEYGLLGLLVFIFLHEMCDFSWLTFVSLTSNRASGIWGRKAQMALTAVSVTILIVFGIWFLVSGTTTLLRIYG